MSGADFRRWVRFYAYQYELQERIEWQLAQVCSILGAGFFRLETSPADWIPSVQAEPEAVTLTDRELMQELARSFGAEIRYA